MHAEVPFSQIGLRDGVIVNTIWQFIAQFARRYANEYFLTFEQVHPGISVGGILILHIYQKDMPSASPKKIGVLEFHIDGPVAGRVIVKKASSRFVDDHLHGRNSLVCELISAGYLQFYEKIVSELGLPRWEAPLPRANKFAISTQFVSLVQNSLSVYAGEFRPMCGSVQYSSDVPCQATDFHADWAYLYFDEQKLSGPGFIGRPENEISGLFSVQSFDDFQCVSLHFVINTSEARIRILEKGEFGKHIDIAVLYRSDRRRFVELAASLALEISQKAQSPQ